MPLIDIADPHCKLPDVLILDASVLLELRSSTKTGGGRYYVTQFLKRISKESLSGNILCLTPVSTLDECYFMILKTAYENELTTHRVRLQNKYPAKRTITWHDLYKDSSHLIGKFMPVLEQFRAILVGIPLVFIEPEDLVGTKAIVATQPSIEERMRHYIYSVPILPTDAHFLAVAERLNVDAIATLDKDFHGLSSWKIYTII